MCIFRGLKSQKGLFLGNAKYPRHSLSSLYYSHIYAGSVSVLCPGVYIAMNGQVSHKVQFSFFHPSSLFCIFLNHRLSLCNCCLQLSSSMILTFIDNPALSVCLLYLCCTFCIFTHLELVSTAYLIILSLIIFI